MNLLISAEALWLGFGIAFFLLMVGVSLMAYTWLHDPTEQPGEEKDIPHCENDFFFTERPYNPYELYN